MSGITIELISCRTDDGIDLAGALFLPGGNMSSTAIALFPGTGAEFYQPLFARLCPLLAAAGYATLAMNRRDHGQFFGYFSLHDAAMDQRLGIDLLAARGAERVVLGGHSYGTVTAPYYVAESDDPRVTALLLYAALGDLRRGSMLMAGGEALYREMVALARQKVAAGNGEEIYVNPPMVPGDRPLPHRYDIFLDKRGPESRAVPTELIRHVGDRPLLAFRDPSDPFPATLPPAQQQLEAANPNLRYILLEERAAPGIDPSRHHFDGRESEIADLTLKWLAETGLHPT